MIELDTEATWHGTANGYNNHGCRCDLCRAANTEQQRVYNAKKRVQRMGNILETQNRRHLSRWQCRCNDCDYTTETAVAMHEHCMRTHGRRISDTERTPRC